MEWTVRKDSQGTRRGTGMLRFEQLLVLFRWTPCDLGSYEEVVEHHHHFSPVVQFRADGSWPPCERVLKCQCGEESWMKPELYFRPEDVSEFHKR
jgi:hypothetical protein